jgi:hypothetical protein
LGDDVFPGHGQSRDEELTKLKKKVVQLTKERGLLKQANHDAFAIRVNVV